VEQEMIKLKAVTEMILSLAVLMMMRLMAIKEMISSKED